MYIYDVSCASESFSLASTVLYYVYSAALPELHVWPAPAFAARHAGLCSAPRHAGLWRRIVEQEDRLLLRQSVVSADLVLFRPKIKTLL